MKTNFSPQLWRILSYKRPFIDEYARDLIFQISTNECTLLFNKEKGLIHIDIIGETARRFITIFANILASNEIDLEKYKVILPTPNGINAIIKPDDKDTSQTTTQTHLVLPTCISKCDLQVNGSKCSSVRSLINDCNRNDQIIDFSDMSLLKHSLGLKLHILKIQCKLGINCGKLMLIAQKVDSFTGVQEYSKSVEYL